jgi:hypothetical protein
MRPFIKALLVIFVTMVMALALVILIEQFLGFGMSNIHF